MARSTLSLSPSARVLVAGEDAELRARLRDRLSASGLVVAAEATTVDELVAAVKRERQDLVLHDPELTSLNALVPEAAVVVLAPELPTVVYEDRALLVDRSGELRLPGLKLSRSRGRPKLRVRGHVEPDPRDEALVTALAEAFAALDWPCSRPESLPVLLGELEGPLGRWPFYVQAAAALGVVAFVSVCPLRVKAELRLDVAGFLANVNRDLAHGAFELDANDGEVRFKTLLPVEDAPIGTGLVRRLVRANGIAVESVLPELRAVATGRLARPASRRI
jgi:hypothetical protein